MSFEQYLRDNPMPTKTIDNKNYRELGRQYEKKYCELKYGGCNKRNYSLHTFDGYRNRRRTFLFRSVDEYHSTNLKVMEDLCIFLNEILNENEKLKNEMNIKQNLYWW